jgi:hypothetical protein
VAISWDCFVVSLLAMTGIMVVIASGTKWSVAISWDCFVVSLLAMKKEIKLFGKVVEKIYNVRNEEKSI